MATVTFETNPAVFANTLADGVAFRIAPTGTVLYLKATSSSAINENLGTVEALDGSTLVNAIAESRITITVAP